MKNNLINDNEIKLTKEQLLFLESSVKKLMDNKNYELASIMASNIFKYIGKEQHYKTKKLKR